MAPANEHMRWKWIRFDFISFSFSRIRYAYAERRARGSRSHDGTLLPTRTDAGVHALLSLERDMHGLRIAFIAAAKRLSKLLYEMISGDIDDVLTAR
jgi:hypothetical protein